MLACGPLDSAAVERPGRRRRCRSALPCRAARSPPFTREVRIDPRTEPGLFLPPLEALLDEDLADPTAAHGDALLAQVGDQAIQRPAGERQAQSRRPGQGGVDHRAALLGRVGWRSTAAHVLLQPLQPARVEALEPVPHRSPTQVHAGADFRRFQTLERMHDDLGSSHQAGTQGARPRHLPQSLPLLLARRTHANGHGRAPSDRHDPL